MNSTKNKVMYTSTQFRLDRLPRCLLMCGANIIGHVNSYVYLGITFDAAMSIAYIPPERKIPGVGGWRWAMPPTPAFCVGDTNMLVS